MCVSVSVSVCLCVCVCVCVRAWCLGPTHVPSPPLQVCSGSTDSTCVVPRPGGVAGSLYAPVVRLGLSCSFATSFGSEFVGDALFALRPCVCGSVTWLLALVSQDMASADPKVMAACRIQIDLLPSTLVSTAPALSIPVGLEYFNLHRGAG